MEDLSKHQLILVALLVSFVTSLATGIFTVSLMNQAPKGVVQTINQVVERIVAPQNASVNDATSPVINAEDRITNAVAQVSKSVVKLRSIGSDTIVGLGLVISKNGIIIADKSTLAQLTGFEAVFADGSHSIMTTIQSQINGDIVFLAPNVTASSTFTPISFARSPKLGQTILTLSGTASHNGESTSSLVLAQGIVSRTLLDNINPDGSQPALIDTSISVSNSGSKTTLGSPLFNLDGEVIGINTQTVSKGSDTATFYPITQLKGAIPKVQ